MGACQKQEVEEVDMEFLELAKCRYSCREFSEKKVEKELIDKIIDAAILSPTAVNKQPYRIWSIESDEGKEKVKQVTKFTFGAGTFLVVGAKEDEAWTRKYDNRNFADVDAAIVATHMMMEVTDLGLGTTWVGYFDAPLMKELFPEMKDYDLIAIFPIGYEKEGVEPSPRHTERKTREEVVEVL